MTVPEGDVHDGAGERGIGAWSRCKVHICNGGGAGAVGINHDQFRPTLLSRAGDVRHDVDLGGDGIAAPHNNQIGLRHLSRVRSLIAPDPGEPAGFYRLMCRS